MSEEFDNIENTQAETLDSPLVVHKIGDASYQEAAPDGGMQTTHIDDDSDAPTLERHRFKKKKKIKKWPFVLLIIIAAVAVIIAVLVNNGTISFDTGEVEETTQAKKSYTTTAENPFEGIITIKGTYVFFEGTEVDGISGLEKEIKYLDEGTSFIIQDENADSNFLNYEVLSLLTNYGMNYEITHVVSSGLISQYETTAQETSEQDTTVEQTDEDTQTDDNAVETND